MKILPDENIPPKVTTDFGKEYEIKTVHDKKWIGKKNGELLGLMVFNGFDFFITLDKNLKHQQNLDKFDITIFVLLCLLKLSNRYSATEAVFILRIKSALTQ